MAVHYLEFSVQMSSLSIEDAAEVERILLALREAARNIHPNMIYSGDVEVELECSAGTLSIGELPGMFWTGPPHVPD